jgi:nucleoside-diphosphate-sugar epimerase
LAGPYKTDYRGTVALIDASVKAGVKKMVLVTSLLTNGAAAGQVFNKNYLLLNLFGLILYWKNQAEKHLMRQSALDWTIVRPGGLREAPREGNIVYGKADKIFGGAISRDFVADVVVAALGSKAASNKVVEIIATEDAPRQSYEQGFASV